MANYWFSIRRFRIKSEPAVPGERNQVPDRKFKLSALELLLLATIVVGLAFMIRVIVAPGADSRLSAAVSQLEQRMMELSDRLNLVGNAVPATPAGSGGTKSAADLYGELEDRLNRLEQKVGALERRLAEQGGGASPDGVALIRESPRKTPVSGRTDSDRP
jgi:hypothetical protein